MVTLFPNRDRDVYFQNYKRPTIEIIKENSITHDRIENVPFQVWYASNNTATGEYNDLGVFYTDEEGRIVLSDPDLSLRDGWFRVKELEPAPGFALADPDTQEARGTHSALATGLSRPFPYGNMTVRPGPLLRGLCSRSGISPATPPAPAERSSVPTALR